MGSISDILHKSSIFNSLDKKDLEQITPLFERRELNIGDVIAMAGDAAQYFFLLEKGTLLLAMEEGKSLVLDRAGDFIAMELLSHRGRYKTIVTALEGGGVFTIPREDFLAFIQEDTPGAAAIMQAWQGFLDQAAVFAKNIEESVVPAIF
jgi:CRP-like cAMP-binding protein